jgi:arylsulfatase A-like enzyme
LACSGGVLLGLVACAGRHPTIEARRLIDDLGRAEILWPASAGNTPRVGLEPSPLAPGKSPVYVARVLMYGDRAAGTPKLRPEGHESRLALLAPAGAVYRFRLTPPRDAQLRLGLGYLPTDQLPAPELTFKVLIEHDDGTASLLDETLTVRSDGGWRDVRLSLEAWADKRIALRLETTARSPVWGAWSAPEVLVTDQREPGWDVLLISLDTLRADRLGCYGYSRPTSPHLDRLAERSVRFATAVSQSPWTRPSHRSLLNGLYPVSRQGLSSPPLAVMLWQAGYRTRALTGGGQLHYRFGFQRGFEEYRITDWLRVIDDAARHLTVESERRQFLFLHTYEPHDPFTHTELASGLPRGRIGQSFSNRDHQRLKGTLSAAEKTYIEALYDGGIAFTDRQLGRLLEKLTASGVMEHTVVLVTSDHGEQFWEHGNFRHGQNMYDHQLLVPLILYLPPDLRRQLGLDPELAGSVIRQQVRLVDLYPTILDLLAIPLSHPVQGRSLRPLLEGRALAPVEAFAENTNVKIERKALRSERHKLVHTVGRDRLELFDLLADPGEQVNLANQLPDLARLLVSRLNFITGQGSGERDEEVPAGIDPELRQQLEALGYLDQ